MLHNQNINLLIFLTYLLPNISTIVYSKLHEKYHICIFIPKTKQKMSLKKIITPIILVIFYPQNEKGKKKTKHLLYYCQSHFFLFAGLRICPPRPDAGSCRPRIMRDWLIRVNELKR